MSAVVMEPPAERVNHPHKPIENVPGRLGLWPVNKVVAAIGLPWQRRLSRAALLIPRIRYWERQFLNFRTVSLWPTSSFWRSTAKTSK